MRRAEGARAVTFGSLSLRNECLIYLENRLMVERIIRTKGFLIDPFAKFLIKISFPLLRLLYLCYLVGEPLPRQNRHKATPISDLDEPNLLQFVYCIINATHAEAKREGGGVIFYPMSLPGR